MRRALMLARKGLGRTSPNPAVGAVVVRGARVVSGGYHRKAGLAHAEVAALEGAGKGAGGADLYVTLEPCPHRGRTPPCVEAIVSAGIKRVFIGAKDPNLRVRGRGIRALKKAGVRTSAGLLEAECTSLNEAYNKHASTGLPFVLLKLAESLDGRIALSTGESKWITSLESRRYVHKLRSLVDCVMVGSGTVLADDPALNVRLSKSRGVNPVRAIIDSSLTLSPGARVFSTSGGLVHVFTTNKAPENRIKSLESAGAEVITLPETRAGVSLRRVMKELGKRDVTSLMIEGGSSLAATALKEGLVDKVAIFVAPMLIGADGLGSVSELGLRKLNKAIRLKKMHAKKLGPDVLLEGYL